MVVDLNFSFIYKNAGFLNHIIDRYDDPAVALHYGGMLRDCLRHQVVAR